MGVVAVLRGVVMVVMIVRNTVLGVAVSVVMVMMAVVIAMVGRDRRPASRLLLDCEAVLLEGEVDRERELQREKTNARRHGDAVRAETSSRTVFPDCGHDLLHYGQHGGETARVLTSEVYRDVARSVEADSPQKFGQAAIGMLSARGARAVQPPSLRIDP